MPDKSKDGCRDSGKPVSMIIFSGMKDPIVLCDGGQVKLGGMDFGSAVGTHPPLVQNPCLGSINVEK